MRIALLIFLLMPILEITGFVVVGGYLGVVGTIGLTILSSVVGMMVLRTQGLSTLSRMNRERVSAEDAGRDLVNGLMIAVAGLLLIIPGFITDIIGLLLLLPPVRQAAWGFARRHFIILQTSGMRFRAGSAGDRRQPPQDDGNGPIIDLDEDEYRRRSDSTRPGASSERGRIGDNQSR